MRPGKVITYVTRPQANKNEILTSSSPIQRGDARHVFPVLLLPARDAPTD